MLISPHLTRLHANKHARGHPPPAASDNAPAADALRQPELPPPLSGLCLFAGGADCLVSRVEAFEMRSCWRGEEEAVGVFDGVEGGGAEAKVEAEGEGEEKDEDEGGAAVVRTEFLHHLHISN
jgi:hypothetical protein